MGAPISDMLNKSLARTKTILFSPFSLKKWMKLLFIAYLAGVMSTGSGGGSGSSNQNSDKNTETITSEQHVAEEEVASESEALELTTPMERGVGADGTAGPVLLDEETTKDNTRNWPLIIVAIIAGVVLFVIPLVILFMWLNARFSFVWLRAIIDNDPQVKKTFAECQGEGQSLFRFNCLVFFSIICVVLGLVAWVYFVGMGMGAFSEGFAWTFKAGFIIGIVPVFTVLAAIPVFVVLSFLLSNFIVPIMNKQKTTIKPAFTHCWNVIKRKKKDTFVFLALMIGLGIASMILKTIVSFVCLLVVGLCAAILIGIPYLVFMVFLKIKVIFIILAILLGLPLLVGMMVLFMSVNLPFAVFFRVFSLYFLGYIDPETRFLIDEDAAPEVTFTP